jgi:hypothetical protein
MSRSSPAYQAPKSTAPLRRAKHSPTARYTASLRSTPSASSADAYARVAGDGVGWGRGGVRAWVGGDEGQ